MTSTESTAFFPQIPVFRQVQPVTTSCRPETQMPARLELVTLRKRRCV